ncbi:MAG: (d)CMP kinase [Prevotellaceae bacterium]|jgi:cytidylate kinase|nr:(d)CMP kinase [Prevotellaceae bacterium]
MKKITVAIDGFSSCGKSTIAKSLARQTGYIYVDTGAMYRAVALFAMENGWMTDNYIDTAQLQKHLSQIQISFKTNESGIQETYLNGKNVEQEIRSLKVANGASRISALGFVRQELVKQQQLMGIGKGIVMDGRDIGTVVFPRADLKIFVTARPEVRALRRMKELQAKGENPTFEQVLANVRERDLRDTTRTESPLKQAEDAILIDNSNMTIDEQQKLVLNLFNQKEING